MAQYDKIIGMNIMRLRKQNKWTQEQLADKTGVTFQAVSKWENGLSCPDINLLPSLAQLFGISIDELFGEVIAIKEKISGHSNLPWENDDKLRVVVYKGHEFYQENLASEKVTFQYIGSALHIESQVSVYCENVKGNVQAKVTVECKDVSGNINAGQVINCGNVRGNVNAGQVVECGNVEGNVNAVQEVQCGDVEGDVTAKGNVHCGNVEGNVSAEGNIECENIEGGVQAGKDVKCENIEGDVHAHNNVTANEIDGDVRTRNIG